jgi:hypothetical protein
VGETGWEKQTKGKAQSTAAKKFRFMITSFGRDYRFRRHGF